MYNNVLGHFATKGLRKFMTCFREEKEETCFSLEHPRSNSPEAESLCQHRQASSLPSRRSWVSPSVVFVHCKNRKSQYLEFTN